MLGRRKKKKKIMANSIALANLKLCLAWNPVFNRFRRLTISKLKCMILMRQHMLSDQSFYNLMFNRKKKKRVLAPINSIKTRSKATWRLRPPNLRFKTLRSFHKIRRATVPITRANRLPNKLSSLSKYLPQKTNKRKASKISCTNWLKFSRSKVNPKPKIKLPQG